MLAKTRGIVFRYTRYGESSIIVTIFTEAFGLQTYIVNSVRSQGRKNKMALYQPLTLLDMVVYHKENATILRLKEVRCLHPYQTLATDIRKSAIAMFVNEVLNKAVKEQSHAEELAVYLIDSLIALDRSERPENFHLLFLIGLSRYLGFQPQSATEVLGGRLLDAAEEALLTRLLGAHTASEVELTYIQRRNLLDALLRFYATHLENLGEFKSQVVLREVLG
ncbi:MAG: DNA repair protein RecO [Cyclobacteriaceae bacterium]|jgi:DNA repair protein RecO (recombination protein O)|nr:DNA repair protein RecO [Cyclobacteriaceae bacterium]